MERFEDESATSAARTHLLVYSTPDTATTSPDNSTYGSCYNLNLLDSIRRHFDVDLATFLVHVARETPSHLPSQGQLLCIFEHYSMALDGNGFWTAQVCASRTSPSSRLGKLYSFLSLMWSFT